MNDNRLKASPEAIVELLHSFEKFEFADGQLTFWVKDDPIEYAITGYQPGSFTRDLLELIQDYLSKDPSDNG